VIVQHLSPILIRESDAKVLNHDTLFTYRLNSDIFRLVKMNIKEHQEPFVRIVLTAHSYRWKGGVGACYEILDKDQVVVAERWSEEDSVALVTLGELLRSAIGEKASVFPEPARITLQQFLVINEDGCFQ
jgi:hypothetical protein